MTPALLAILVVGIVLPHVLRLERAAPSAAAVLWSVSLAMRAQLVIFVVLYLAVLMPSTLLFVRLTHWCVHAAVPVLATQLPVDGAQVGIAAVILPGLAATASLLTVGFGVVRCARAIRHALARDSLGPGPSGSVIVAGRGVLLAAAGLARPRVIVSAGALLELEDDELAAGLDHERGHIARRHRYLFVLAELCRGAGLPVPGRRQAMRELAFHLERDADRWALHRSHSPFALAGAICKATGDWGEPSWAVASIRGGSAAKRLDELVQDPARPVLDRGHLVEALAVVMVGAALLVAALVPSSAAADAQDHSAPQPAHHHCHHESGHAGR